MHVLILGGGVIGVTTAFALLEDGHQVTLVERNAGPGEETSFANGGLIVPGHSFAWASPKAPLMLLRSLYRDDQALRFRPSTDPALWRWSWRFLGQCRRRAWVKPFWAIISPLAPAAPGNRWCSLSQTDCRARCPW